MSKHHAGPHPLVPLNNFIIDHIALAKLEDKAITLEIAEKDDFYQS